MEAGSHPQEPGRPDAAFPWRTHLPGLGLTDAMVAQLEALRPLYVHWNAMINVISRKDMDAFEVHHVLHSCAIARVMRFSPGSRVLDVGTGGGFPGIPLAILHPEVQFVLCDSIGKKIRVVQAVVDALGLPNVTVVHGRAEQIRGRFDFVVSRAVTDLASFMPWVANKFETRTINPWPNGVLYLKGGDLSGELGRLKGFDCEVIPIQPLFPNEPYFQAKSVVYIR